MSAGTTVGQASVLVDVACRRAGVRQVPWSWVRLLVVLVLASVTLVVPFRREFIMASSQEFANYGDLARHVRSGSGALTNLGQPVDLRYLHDLHGAALAPPWPTVFRPLGPAYLAALATALVGDRDGAVLFGAALGYLAMAIVTLLLGELYFGRGLGLLAALLVVASRSLLSNVYNAYPDCLFAASMTLLFLAYLRGSERSPVRGAFLVGCCAGLAQLSRVNLIMWVPVFAGFFLLTAPPGRRLKAIGAFGVGLALIGSPEWVYDLAHFGSLGRGNVGLQNLANVRYQETWLYYVALDPGAIVREHLAALVPMALRNTATLAVACLTGIEGPLGPEGAPRRIVAGVLFLSGFVFARQGVYSRPLLRAWQLALALLAMQIPVFAVLRPNLRYFYWFLPIFWLFALLNAKLLLDGLASRVDVARSRRHLVRAAAGVAIGALSVVRIAGMITGRVPVYLDEHAFQPAELREIRDHQLPVLRRSIPPGSVVASDRAFVLWYLDDIVHIPLPLDHASLAGIERDYFPIDFIYLTGRFFRGVPDSDYDNYTNAYLLDGAGRVVDASSREAHVLAQFPAFSPVERFGDGAMLLKRTDARG